jgi:thiamine kinase-like enzyme
MVKLSEGVGLHKTWENFFTLNLNKHIDTCFKIKSISLEEKRLINKIFSDNKFLLKNITPSIIHNDLSARNMFVDKNNMITLIDWEDAICGDPVFDIASFGTFCYRPEHSKRVEYFLEGYTKLRNLPIDFKKRYWFYYLRVALLKTALLARHGSLNEEQSHRIQRALKELI